MEDSVLSLYHIDRLPINLPNNSIVYYPKMKLGSQEGARYFSKMLAPLASDLIRSYPSIDDWVLTAPPLNMIYSGANWLCHHTYHLLKDTLPERVNLSLVDIQVSSESISNSSRVPYSQLSVKDRITSRQGGKQPLLLKDDFYKRAVIFMNDINVTGTQQRFMESHFASVVPSMLHWLYVINVDSAVGQAKPQLEYELNTVSHSTSREFADLLMCERMEYTGQCLWRLFSFSTGELEQLLPTLGQDRISKLLELAIIEDRWHDENARKKLEIMRTYSTSTAASFI